jgi:hypothetical protein
MLVQKKELCSAVTPVSITIVQETEPIFINKKPYTNNRMKKAVFFIKRDRLMDKVFEAFRKKSEVKVTDIVKKFATSQFYNTILKNIWEINQVARNHLSEMNLFTQYVKAEENGKPYKVLKKHPGAKITATGNYYIIEVDSDTTRESRT